MLPWIISTTTAAFHQASGPAGSVIGAADVDDESTTAASINNNRKLLQQVGDNNADIYCIAYKNLYTNVLVYKFLGALLERYTCYDVQSV